MRSMRKGYFTPPVLIILAIIIFAVAILIAINADFVKRIKSESSPTQSLNPSPSTQQSNPTTNETTDWKTYTNYSIKLSFKYPPNYTFYEDTKFKPDSTYLGFFFSSEEQRKKFLGCLKLCDIYDIGLSVGVILIPSFEKLGFPITPYTYITVANKQALTRQHPFERGGLAREVYVDVGDSILSIFSNTSENASKSPEDSMKVFDQILSTFQFID